MTEEEWGPWIEHDGSGCPCPNGTFIQAVLMGRSGLTQTVETKVKGAGAKISCWTMKSRFGPMRQVIRYRIRRPRAMKQFDEILRKVGDRVDA